MIRLEIAKLAEMGEFPASKAADVALVRQRQELLSRVTPPISDDEAKELIRVFGPDDYYGLAWTVLHLIESSPHWPLVECLSRGSNEWIVRLRDRAAKKEGLKR